LNYKTKILQNSSAYCVILRSHLTLLPIRPFRVFLSFQKKTDQNYRPTLPLNRSYRIAGDRLIELVFRNADT